MEQIMDHKVYREKPHKHSNKEPFGIAIFGKSKEYLVAQQNLNGIIIKGKVYKVAEEIKILDITEALLYQ